MIRLLQIEWIKNKGNLSFWILLGLYTTAFGAACSLGKVLMNATIEITSNSDTPAQLPNFNIYSFPEIWHNLAYLSSWVKIILGIIVISTISNEVNQRTMKQNIIDGMSRLEFLGSKYLTIFVLSIVSTVLLIAFVTYFGTSYGENGMEQGIYEKTDFISGHFFQILTFLSFCLFVGLFIKSTGLAIVFMLVWTIFMESFVFWILSFGIGDAIAAYMPIHVVDSLVSAPFNLLDPESVQTNVTTQSIIFGLGWVAIFFSGSYFKLSKTGI